MGDKVMVLKLGVYLNSSWNCLGLKSEKKNSKEFIL